MVQEQGTSNAELSQEPLTSVDAVLIVLGVAFILFLSWFRSRQSVFWSDEIMSWLVLRQDTWAHMFRLWWHGIDSSGLFFLIFGRGWIAVFGATLLSIHLFAATCVGAAFVLLWLCCRLYFSRAVVAGIVPFVFFANDTLLWQIANGRTYGLALAAFALCSYALLRTDPRAPDANRTSLLVLTFAAFSLLMGSQLLGVLYSGCLFSGFIARDLYFRVFRPKLYAAALAGLIILVPSWGSITATAALGKPGFWTLPPSRGDLLHGLFAYSRPTLRLTFFFCLAFLGLVCIRRLKNQKERLFLAPRASLYFLIGSYILVPVTIFAVSRVGTSIFADRYVMPVLLGNALLLCELAERLLAMLATPRSLRLAAMCVALCLTAVRYVRDLHVDIGFPPHDRTQELLREIPPGAPIVVTSIGDFVDIIFYHDAERTFLNPIDWPVELDPASGEKDVSGMHQMEQFRADGLYAKHIQPTAQILRENPTFYVVSDAKHTLWFRARVLSDAGYRITRLPDCMGPGSFLNVWKVERGG